MTRDDYINRVKVFAEKYTDDDEMMDFFREVQTDYESGEGREGGDGEDWKKKFDDMKRKYIDRFFSSEEQAKRDQREDNEGDVERTEEEVEDKKESFEDLFKEESESDYKEKED